MVTPYALILLQNLVGKSDCLSNMFGTYLIVRIVKACTLVFNLKDSPVSDQNTTEVNAQMIPIERKGFTRFQMDSNR